MFNLVYAFLLRISKKNIFSRHIARLLHISYQLLSSIRQEKRDIDKSIILLEIKHGISDAQMGRILPVILYQTAPCNTCSRLNLDRNHIQTTLNDEFYFRRISLCPIMRTFDAISHQTLKNIVLSQSTLVFLKDWIITQVCLRTQLCKNSQQAHIKTVNLEDA